MESLQGKHWSPRQAPHNGCLEGSDLSDFLSGRGCAVVTRGSPQPGSPAYIRLPGQPQSLSRWSPGQGGKEGAVGEIHG